MAEKIYTIILKVDLECRSCYKKISKTICKIQEKENIHTITFDEKKNTVTISGPFDPKKVTRKLCCKASSVIKDLQLRDEKEKPKDAKPAEPAKDKPKDAKPAEPAKPKVDAEPKKDKPKDAKPAEPTEPKKDKAKDAEPKKDKPKDSEPKKDKPKDAEPKKDKAEPVASISAMTYTVPAYQGSYYQPAWAEPVCACGSRPGYEGYYNGDNGGCYCSRPYSWPAEAPPAVSQQMVVYGMPAVYGGYNKTSQYFSEEDPQSCSIM